MHKSGRASFPFWACPLQQIRRVCKIRIAPGPFCRNGYRSRLFVSAALRLACALLHSAPLTDSPLFSRSCPVEMQYAHGSSRCSVAVGCPGPLLTYRCAECSSLLIVYSHQTISPPDLVLVHSPGANMRLNFSGGRENRAII